MKTLFRCWLLAVLLVSLPFFLGCGSFDLGGREGETVSWKLPDLSAIANPDDAEKALYAGVKAYEFTVGRINQRHAAGEISDARHEELMKIADRYRVFALIAWNGAQFWRNGGARVEFDGAYFEIAKAIIRLNEGAKR